MRKVVPERVKKELVGLSEVGVQIDNFLKEEHPPGNLPHLLIDSVEKDKQKNENDKPDDPEHHRVNVGVWWVIIHLVWVCIVVVVASIHCMRVVFF